MRMKKPVLILLAGSFSIISHVSFSNAACTRSDVEFYLSQGFTPEQVTSICADGKPPSSETDSSKKKIEINNNVQTENATPSLQDKFSEQGIEGRKKMAKRILPSAIDGYDVYLTDENLHYTLKTCFEYGEEDLFGFREKACPEVQYIISWEGLEVKKAWKEYYFLGRSQVKVKGQIQRKILSGLDAVKPSERSKIDKELDHGAETVIPIRDDVSVSRVKEALMTLSR